MHFEIRYATEAVEDVGSLRAYDQRTIRAVITKHLTREPTRLSRSRI